MLIEIKTPAPILNTPDFRFAFGGKTGDEIPLNKNKQPLFFEFVALKGTVFQVENVLIKNQISIYQISSSAYPKKELYVDSRFTQTAYKYNLNEMPSHKNILEKMKALTGTPYVWGGNWSLGIPEMLQFYPPKKGLNTNTHILWTLQGVDCSGLLYESSNGASPRNTHQLVCWGDPVTELSDLKPLDMFVYPGHVFFVLDKETAIESRFPQGVVETPLTTRINELLETRSKVDHWNKSLDPKRFYTIRRI